MNKIENEQDIKLLEPTKQRNPSKLYNKALLVHGVGINDATYPIRPVDGEGKQRKMCPFYVRWANMLKRCYDTSCLTKYPTYIGCSVCEEWLTFSNFKAWMEEQDWQGKELDKDLLVQGNKIYSPSTCVFVDSALNSFILDNKWRRGEYLIGVDFSKKSNCFRARCANPFTKKAEHLGLFTSEIEAHRAWFSKKLEWAEALSKLQKDERLAVALLSMFKFEGDFREYVTE